MSNRRATPPPQLLGEPSQDREAAAASPNVEVPKESSLSMAILRKAIRENNFDVVNQRLINGEEHLRKGNTRLRLGAKTEKVGQKHDGKTPLHLAVYRDQLDGVQFLLKNGADVNALDQKGNSPLHEAARIKSAFSTRLLLEAGADPNSRNKRGATPFEASIDWMESDLFAFYIRHGASLTPAISKYIDRLLRVALLGFDIVTITRVLSFDGIRLRHVNLSWLIQSGKFDESTILQIAKMMIKRGASVDGDSDGRHCPLFYSVDRGFLRLAEFLLEKGASVDKPEVVKPILYLAIELRDFGMIELLLRYGVRVDFCNRAGESVLMRFVDSLGRNAQLHEEGFQITPLDVEMATFESLVAKGAPVNGANQGSRTALSRAIRINCRQIVDHLLDKGAVVQDGSAFLVAVRYGRLELLKLLLSKGATLNVDEVYLAFAARSFHYPMAEYLLDMGADVNAKMLGRVPLWHAWDNYIDNESNPERATRCERVIRVLVKHITLLEAKTGRMDANNREVIDSMRLGDFYDMCKGEIDRCKKTRVCEGYATTYYDILIGKSNNALSTCLRCYPVREKLQSDNLLKMFTFYGDKMEVRLEKGLSVLKEKLRLEEVLQEVLGNLLPEVVIRKITDFYNVS